MYTLISFPAGVIVEAVVLATGPNRLRAVAAGIADAIELQCSGSQWLTEKGEPVEFEFLMSDSQPSVDASSSRSGSVVRTMSAMSV